MACYDLCLEKSMSALERYEPNRISLNKKRHYQCVDFPNVPEGILLPSVTTVLSTMQPIGKTMALINWRKRVGNEEANRRTRLAAERGTWMHGVIEDSFNGEDIEIHLDQAPQWMPYYEAVEDFLGDIAEPVLVESAVAWWDEESRSGYSGTLDMVAMMNSGSIALLDWKTSFKKKPASQLADYKKQLGAYSMAFEQMYNSKVDEAYCVIACYDPEKPETKASLQVVQLNGLELVMQQRLMASTVEEYFKEHYPGGEAFALTPDKG